MQSQNEFKGIQDMVMSSEDNLAGVTSSASLAGFVDIIHIVEMRGFDVAHILACIYSIHRNASIDGDVLIYDVQGSLIMRPPVRPISPDSPRSRTNSVVADSPKC